MTKTTRRKPAYRLWWFWLLALALAWLIAGFGLVPLYLSSAIPERAGEHLGWSVQMDDVSFNPFTLTVSVHGLQADDKSGRVFEVDEASLDIGLARLVRGTLHIEQLVLDDPFLRVDVLPDNRLALTEAWRRHNADDATGDGLPMDVLLGKGVVNGGRLQVRTLSGEEGGEPRVFTVEALGLTLSDVASWQQDEGGQYSLQGAMGDLVLDSSGKFHLMPLWSNGRVVLGNVTADVLSPLLDGHFPWTMKSGRLSLETTFQFARDDQGIALATREGVLGARALELADPDNPDETLASADTLDLDGVAFRLDGPELIISRVTGKAIHLNAVMDESSGLNLTRPLRAAGEQQTDAGPSSLRWSVGRVELGDGTIDWQDRRPQNDVELALEGVELSLGAMTEQLEEPISYQARASLAAGGSASADGQFTLLPLTFEGGVNLDQLVLSPFGGYLKQFSEVDVQDGIVNLSGNIDIDVQDDPLTGTFSGRGSISQFSGRLPDEEQTTVAWRELRLDPIEYNFEPARLELGTVTLSEPELNVVQHPDRPLNIVRLLTSAGDAQGSAGDDDTGAGMIFRLRQLDVANAEIRYTDHTPQPSFASRLHDLQASVSGLSNITPQQGRFSLQGTLADSGALRANGSIATLGTDGRSQADVTLEGLSMPVLNPYFGYYLGYHVDAGKLSVEGDYQLRGTGIEATNRLVMDRLELGEAVASDDTITAPVRLGLTLLRDNDNRLTLDIPVTGDLSDPDFSLGPVMMRTLRSTLVKAAMSPFRLLGSVVDLGDYSPEQMSGVAFLPGETTLKMGEYTKMETVARVLEARGNIILSIRGLALESVDRPALEADLEEEESLPDNALEDLASQRGTTLKRLLVEEYGVSEEQIFLRSPEVRAGDDEEEAVSIEFELEAS